MSRIYTDELREFARRYDSYEEFLAGLEEADEYPMSIFKDYASRMKKSFWYLCTRFPDKSFDHSRWIAAYPSITKLSHFVSDVVTTSYEQSRSMRARGFVFLLDNGSLEPLESKSGYQYWVKPKFEIDEGTFFQHFLETLRIGWQADDTHYGLIANKGHVTWLVAVVELDVKVKSFDPKSVKNPT